MIYDIWDIIVAPFPFVENVNSKNRPVLVLSHKNFNKENRHTVLAMITTGSGITWKSDTPIQSLKGAGIKVPSLIRMKIFTLDNRILKYKIGELHATERSNISKKLFQEVFMDPHLPE
jgi:mRNA interferase MazF